MTQADTTHLDAFNARNANPVEVAGSFVFSKHFELLAGDWHAIIIGPRGSGKTTLLKMLQVNALRTWEGDDASRVVPSIRNVGVYVPSDVTWSTQLESIKDGKPISLQTVELVRNAAFTAHVHQALLRAIEDRRSPPADARYPTFLHLALDGEQEATLVDAIATAWSLDPRLPKLSSVRRALDERHSVIGREAKRLTLGLSPDDVSSLVQQHPFLELEAIRSSLTVIKEVNALSADVDRRWALLFDELEILPASVQRGILRLLRSTDQELLFKIAISPHTPEWAAVLSDEHGPRDANDYREVPLWYTDRTSMHEFGHRLLDRQIAAAGLGVSTALELLGKSQIFGLDEDRQTRASGYRSGGRWPATFNSLAAKDPTFRAFLERKKIDPEHLDARDATTDGPLVRKITPLVALRDFYRTGGAAKARSRKVVPYTGVAALVAATEGNPRWIIALAKSLIAKARERRSFPLSPSIQSDELNNVSKRFEAMLRSAPVGSIPARPAKTGVWELLEKIGTAQKHEILYSDFKEEPACAWLVDQDCPAWQEALLKLALNFGGIVHLPDGDSSASIDTLRGNRFRLSFLLAPKFALPLRSTKSVTLSRLLVDNSKDLFRD